MKVGHATLLLVGVIVVVLIAAWIERPEDHELEPFTRYFTGVVDQQVAIADRPDGDKFIAVPGAWVVSDPECSVLEGPCEAYTVLGLNAVTS